jgi:hypothetical protein
VTAGVAAVVPSLSVQAAAVSTTAAVIPTAAVSCANLGRRDVGARLIHYPFLCVVPSRLWRGSPSNRRLRGRDVINVFPSGLHCGTMDVIEFQKGRYTTETTRDDARTPVS